MSDPTNLAKYRMTGAQALKRIRELAANSGNLQWATHIRERMQERGILDVDVLRILRNGDIEGIPEAGRNSGEWRVKLTHRLANGRTAGVVTVILMNGRLRLVTVEWEDHR